MMKRKGLFLFCQGCGKQFYAKQSDKNQKYCSNECSWKSMPKKGVHIKCIQCGKEFYVAQHRKETAKYCSNDCRTKYLTRNGFKKICPECGEEFYARQICKMQKYCSSKCKFSHARTEAEKRKVQKNKRYKCSYERSRPAIRKKAFETHGESCYICGYSEYSFCLDLHHVDGSANNNNVENLLPLCAMCHRKLHKGILKLSDAIYLNPIISSARWGSVSGEPQRPKSYFAGGRR